MSIESWCFVLGMLLAGAGLFAGLVPSLAARGVAAFPRHVWTGRVLSAVAWIWAAWELWTMGLDVVEAYRVLIIPFTLISIPLTWWWLDNLLACRALAGILMLFPCGLFYAARPEMSAWRLLPVTLAYVCLTAGMVFMFYPWRLRQALAWLVARPLIFRVVSGIVAALGTVLIVVGLIAF